MIDRWNADDLPFFEPQLEEYFHQTLRVQKNIEFTTEVARCIKEGDVIYISVNTPPIKQTKLELQEQKDNLETDQKWIPQAMGV